MICEDNQRRVLVRAHRDKHGRRDMNGLDYVEVTKTKEAKEAKKDETTLLVYFIGKLPPQMRTDRPALTKFLRIEGGRRVRDIQVVDVDPHIEDDPERDDYLIVTVDKPGDFSTYTLRLIGVDGIDPLYDHTNFTFHVDCPSDIDCALPDTCPPSKLDEPDINYLAKDYASFRQLILDRLALIMPDWKERHAPDLGIALVELLAYAGDHLSYYQDAVATEAYLDTARQRISVRRHARLVDYFLHEGCNARAWICFSIFGGNLNLNLKSVYFVTSLNAVQSTLRELLSDEEFHRLPTDTYEVFEPVIRSEIVIREAHNEMHFYAWGQRECCLPRGATSASLLDQWVYVGEAPGDDEDNHDDDEDDHKGKDKDKDKDHDKDKDRDNDKEKDKDKHDDKKVVQIAKQRSSEPPPLDKSKLKRALDLHEGDVLIFEEMIGPKTGNPADADPLHRCAVRLTRVTLNEDPVMTAKVRVNETTYDQPTPVIDVEWDVEDALPFTLCLSAIGPAPDCQYLDNVSVARGNVILVDHGRTIRPPEALDEVPLDRSEAQCECGGKASDVLYRPGRFRPSLERPSLTFRQSLPADDPTKHEWVSANRLMMQDARAALPQIRLSEVPASPSGHGQLEPLFEFRDLVDPTQLIQKMRDPEDRYGARVRLRLSHRLEKSISQLKPGELPSPVLIENVRADLRALLRFWEPRFDLLGSGPDDLHFVVEMDNEGIAHLRFGDGELGEQPPAGSAFYADYRVGNGARGNIGAEAISHIVLINTSVSGVNLRVRNPLPAMGGEDPEPMAEAKLYAPFTFRKRLERAIIAYDYAKITGREFNRELQSAAARLAWTGSWYEAEVALDPYNGEPGTRELIESVRQRLEQYRRMGHDLRVETAIHVPLDIELTVCVKPDYLRGHVKAVLLDLFSSRVLSGGKLGFFHPDNLKFGEGIYLSQLVAIAQAVTGVESVKVTRLERLYEGDNSEIDDGVLRLGAFEIAQVDNDPNFPEHGRFTLMMGGGR